MNKLSVMTLGFVKETVPLRHWLREYIRRIKGKKYETHQF